MRRREYLLFLAFVAPNVVLLGVFAYWPVVYNGYLSLTSWDLLSPTKPFVGLANYADMFTDPDFYSVLVRTVLFSGVVVVVSMVAGLAIALLLNQALGGRNFVRTMSFAPHILSGAAIGTIWLFIFDPSYGLLKALLTPLGVASPAWMTDSAWALPGLIIVYLWKNLGFVAVVYLAGLQGLPTDLYEAARIDGAGAWTLFRRLTLPLLSPVTFFIAITSVIGTFQAFDIIAIMTGGGPGDATTTLSWYVYQQAFQALDAGHAGAGAIVMFVILLAITGAQARFMERRVHYR
ncbi:sugar ABC transporter permease [Actinopolymorpha sp. NPDC004070]|uniref:carbohydrate ABC transporter permease n=1 Tax=Actinopolymorpha sp. NPDC004070 TaxID=3154548 RepID=UPI0033B6083A